MISLPGWFAMAAIQVGRKRSSRSWPFQLGITSDAACVSGLVSRIAAAAPATSQSRSVTARAIAAIKIASGKTIRRAARAENAARTLSFVIAYLRAKPQLLTCAEPARGPDLLQFCIQTLRPKRAFRNRSLKFRPGAAPSPRPASSVILADSAFRRSISMPGFADFASRS